MDISTLLSQAAHKWPERIALYEPAVHRSLSFADLDRQLTAFGLALERLNVQAGARVALLAEASINYLLADYGCMATGRVRVPLDPALSGEELLAQVRDAGAQLLLFSSHYQALAGQLRQAGVPCLALEGFAEASALPLPARAAQPAQALASLNYTGGTTGLPKAVMHRHASLCAVLQNIVMARGAVPGDVLLNVRPLWPIAAVAVLGHLLSGGQVVLGGRFEAPAFIGQLREHQAAFSSLVPTQLLRLLREAGTAAADLPSLKTLDIGAAALASEVLEGACQLFGSRLSVLYGMTEAPWSCYLSVAQMAATRAAGESAQGLVGRPVFSAALRIDQPDEQGVGEILIAGPQLMAGYWQQPELTARTLADGWLRSGDLGSIRADGLLSVQGRCKDIIRSGGKSVQPSEVEQSLRELAQVTDVHVFGLADLEWGEQVCAAVVLSEPGALSDQQLIEHCRARLSRFKVPRRIWFLNELPRSHYGKVQQNRLLAELDAGPGQ
ncbi:AMP-binding protein [Pseudomonas sp. LJDD11]|uniref:class I adenylate-forming enzyme family protein n=1 Tax=unclassified Pseudomonas TaxID=196821 RepID=UPI0020983FE5|nr:MULTISPECIES: AMP-binding protein [unclassified Pseudomonas]MCO8163633.1 AMP-binding protein [Pseudomonas sp. 21LCFQ010]MCQ9427352.1 AMP-binding protein [Pseudomonas sp. LJDD11]